MWWTGVAWAGPVTPERATVPATGERGAVFDVAEFGRFAVTAKSSQGAAVTVVDRMAGVIGSDGVPGAADGRVDLFLDRGQVKVVAGSHETGTGEVELKVRPFVAVGPPVVLERERRVEGSLRDLQVASWWVDVPSGGAVSIEAAGRYLADLRLWRDGVWLVDHALSCRTIEPVPGAPWQDCTLAAQVEPGVYLLSAYGGPGSPWTTDAPDEAPLELQWDVPVLPSLGTRSVTLPASGFLRFNVPSVVDTLAVRLPDVAPFKLVGGSGGEPAITTESRRPTAWTRPSGAVSLVGVPGQTLTMTWFDAGNTASVAHAGTYWVGSLSTAHPADVLDPTGLVTGRQDKTVWREAAQAVTLSSTTSLTERFNVGAPVRVLFDVVEAGPYAFSVEGTGATLRLVPQLYGWPEGMEQPRATQGQVSADLAVGLYALEISGQTGVGTLVAGYDSIAARAARALGQGPASQVRRPVFQLAGQALTPLHRLELFSGDTSGLFVRELPLDPTDALPVTLLPSEVVTLDVTVAERGLLTFVTDAGDPLPLAVDGGSLTTEVQLDPGEHAVRLVNPGGEVTSAVLRHAPDAGRAPLRPLSPERAAQLDAFPRLRNGKAVGVELEVEVPRTVRLVVDEPGLWTVESTGLLATTGTLRTRVLPRLAHDSQSGPGRNFQLARYLRPGDYQLTVAADGLSRGHAGLRLAKGVVRDGGEIRDATPARLTLLPGEAVRHTVVVERAGDFHIVQRGRSRTFDCRVEDAAGWTVTGSPDQTCDLVVHLDPGRYTVLGLPDRVETRRHTIVEPADPAQVARSGHGPFPLALSTTQAHTWSEPREGDRPIDVWEGVMPAEARVVVSLSPELAGKVLAGGREVGAVAKGGWSGTLPAGPFRLELQAVRKGTGVPYSVEVTPDPLVAGTSRQVAFGALTDVVVGAAGVYSFESDGFADVRARLTDAAGRVVAANDDRPDDWNFRLSTRLEPGRYALRVTAVDGGVAYSEEGPLDSVTVSMRAPEEVAGPALRERAPATFRPGRSAWLLEVDKAGRPEVVVATATARENVGVAIEVKGDDGAWRSVAVGTGTRAVAVARVNGAPTRLRVWSEDGRGGEVTAEVFPLETRRGGAAVALGKGWGAVAFGGGAGQFAVRDASSGTWVCGVAGGCVAGGGDVLVDAPEEGLVLVREGGTVSAERAALADGAEAVLRVGRRRERIDVGVDGPFVAVLRAATGVVGAQVGDGRGLVSPGATLLVAPEGGKSIGLWASELEDTDVSVELRALTPPRTEPGTDGEHAFALPAGGSVRMGLSAARHLRVDLGEGAAVWLADGRGAWAERASTAVHLRAAEGAVTLVNPTSAEVQVRLDVLPATGGAALVAGSPHEGVHPAAETWVVPVPAAEGSTLQVRGAGATYSRVDGQVDAEAPFDVGPGGVLTLAIEPGPVLAWVETADQPGPARPVGEAPEQVVTGPGALWLSGSAARLVLRPPEPSAISLRAPCPLVATIDAAGGRRVVVADTGDRLDVWVADPAAGARVELRALAGAALYGELATARSVPVVLQEGLGPERLLAPGGSAWFAVDVTREGLVGFGARAEAERVDVVVYDAAGVELARGLVTSRELAPGRYLLALSQRPGTGPVRARPVVVGLSAPPTTPPESVVRSYLPVAGE
jgi:hypothetical protein